MIEEMIVLNGELTPKYDKYNNIYTVQIPKTVSKLKFDFKKDEDVEVSIYGNNNLKEGDNNIVLLVKKDEEQEYIYINVIKETDEAVVELFDNVSSMEVANSMPIYAGPLIAFSCFLIIIWLFLVLFGRKKRS